MVYKLKLRVTVRRAARCLRPSDRLSSPPSVMLLNLIIRTNETSHRCHYSSRIEVESDGMESCKVSKTLR